MGLDGVPWELLNAMMARGNMPTLFSLLPQARSGMLRSTVPPNTGPSWTTFATGKNPGKHGIFDLFRYDEAFLPRPVQSTDIQGETFYEILSTAGLRSILVNLPVTYPPRDFNGVVVGDFLSPKSYIHPVELQPLLEGYRLFYDFRLEGMALVEDILDVERRRIAVARRLFTDQAWDLFFLLFSATDWLSHFYYPTILRGDTALGRRAATLFRNIDDLLGEWMKALPPEAHLVLLSDHGFQECCLSFDLNSWLEARHWAVKRLKDGKRRPAGGRVDVRPSTQALSPIRALRKDDVFTDGMGDGEEHLLVKPSGDEVVIPQGLLRLARRFPWARKMFVSLFQSLGREVKFDSPYELDVERSMALAPRGSLYGLYVNRRIVRDAQEKDRLVSDIIAGLRSLRNPLNQGPAFSLVGERREVYGASSPVESAPDVICIPAPGLYTDISLLHGPKIVPRDSNWHSRDGFVVLKGPAFSPGNLGGADMCDIAPTILALLGIPPPPEMDGRPLLGHGVMVEGAEAPPAGPKVVGRLSGGT